MRWHFLARLYCTRWRLHSLFSLESTWGVFAVCFQHWNWQKHPTVSIHISGDTSIDRRTLDTRGAVPSRILTLKLLSVNLLWTISVNYIWKGFGLTRMIFWATKMILWHPTHIGSELPKVLFKVHFWALLLAKALFWALLKVLILLLELYFALFFALFLVALFLVALFWALF